MDRAAPARTLCSIPMDRADRKNWRTLWQNTDINGVMMPSTLSAVIVSDIADDWRSFWPVTNLAAL